MSGRRFWSKKEDARLAALYPNTPTEKVATELGHSLSSTYQRAYKLGLRKSAAYLASPASGRTNGRQGMGTRFEKGHATYNKGLRRPGWAPGRMAETQFRKGERRGDAVKLYKPIGTERVSSDGYLERKVSDVLPPSGASRAESARIIARRWRAAHLIVWEAAHGPVPRGHAIVFKNGDKMDIRLDNLTLISRADLMRHNSVHNLPAPLPQMVQLIGALNRKINRRNRQDEEQDRGSEKPPVRGAGGTGRQGQPDGAGPREGDRGRGSRSSGFSESGSGFHERNRATRGNGIHHATRGARITATNRRSKQHALLTGRSAFAGGAA